MASFGVGDPDYAVVSGLEALVVVNHMDNTIGGRGRD
jgi:hypothetical protein